MEFRCIRAPEPNRTKWVFEKLTFPFLPTPAKPTVEADVVQFILSKETPPTSYEGNCVTFVAELPVFETKLWIEWRLKIEDQTKLDEEL